MTRESEKIKVNDIKREIFISLRSARRCHFHNKSDFVYYMNVNREVKFIFFSLLPCEFQNESKDFFTLN